MHLIKTVTNSRYIIERAPKHIHHALTLKGPAQEKGRKLPALLSSLRKDHKHLLIQHSPCQQRPCTLPGLTLPASRSLRLREHTQRPTAGRRARSTLPKAALLTRRARPTGAAVLPPHGHPRPSASTLHSPTALRYVQQGRSEFPSFTHPF